ncbi:helix-turn-helix transcriptional regulator [Aestuariivirga sp. YIM B02566]|uniref:Helix-turn-helix transcriptional regulator n=1 Tax=Taklimakanibacter albus TaxID=2800327 RepID=A0ACC5R2D6_9HYPH|nr:AraC family transcriptional regulator [Aestuariivirga sp. YIM B02566]MBK1866800.1 helix-turn-helix transcriptional regulator [Aestuariivirga sp. YIM B02566]
MTTARQSASYRLRTDALPERDRVEIMREIYGRTVLKVDLDPLAPLDVDMTLRALPGLGIATGRCTQLRAYHSTPLIDSDDVVLLVALSGASLMKHRGCEEIVNTDQAVMLSGSEVGSSQIQPGGLRFINMSFSLRRLAPLVGNPAAALMRPLLVATAPMRLLIDYVSAVQAMEHEAPPEIWRLTATHIFDLMAMAMGATGDAAEVARGRGVRVARLRAIKADIAAHGAQLSADDIAIRHRLSPRYVRKLFESDGTSLTDFILAQRLERAHRMLSDPRQAGRNITALAFEAGFNDLSYFNRTFRRRYGATPSEVRATAQGARDDET